MTTAEIKHCLTTYKTYLESNDFKYVFVNELRYPSTKKAVKVSLFCIDFGTKSAPNCTRGGYLVWNEYLKSHAKDRFF